MWHATECLVLQQEAEQVVDMIQEDVGPPAKRLCTAEQDGSTPCSAPSQQIGWDHSYIQLSLSQHASGIISMSKLTCSTLLLCWQ